MNVCSNVPIEVGVSHLANPGEKHLGEELASVPWRQ